MRLCRAVFVLLSLVSVSAQANPLDTPETEDVNHHLVGHWVVERVIEDGQEIPADASSEDRWVFSEDGRVQIRELSVETLESQWHVDGDTLYVQSGGELPTGTYELIEVGANHMRWSLRTHSTLVYELRKVESPAAYQVAANTP